MCSQVRVIPALADMRRKVCDRVIDPDGWNTLWHSRIDVKAPQILFEPLTRCQIRRACSMCTCSVSPTRPTCLPPHPIHAQLQHTEAWHASSLTAALQHALVVTQQTRTRLHRYFQDFSVRRYFQDPPQYVPRIRVSSSQHETPPHQASPHLPWDVHTVKEPCLVRTLPRHVCVTPSLQPARSRA